MFVRFWHLLCAWYLRNVVQAIERKQAKLETEAVHTIAAQKMAHAQQVERLRMSIDHERERLRAKRAHMQEYADLMLCIAKPLRTLRCSDGAISVDHEILGQDPEGILPSKY